MANDLNQCNFVGRLGREVEMRYMPNGDACASFSIAVGEAWKEKTSGEKKESTEWVRCVAWQKLGEICGEYLKKGSQVFVSGKLKTSKWTDKEGNDKYTTEIVVDRLQMLGGRQSQDHPTDQTTPSGRTSTPAASKTSDVDSDEIPF